jgi:hypothetical protein
MTRTFLHLLLSFAVACSTPCASDTGEPPASSDVTGDFPYDVARLYCDKLEVCDPKFYGHTFSGRDDCIALAIDIATQPPGECVDDPAMEQVLLRDLMPDASCRVFQDTDALTLLLVEYGICTR